MTSKNSRGEVGASASPADAGGWQSGTVPPSAAHEASRMVHSPSAVPASTPAAAPSREPKLSAAEKKRLRKAERERERRRRKEEVAEAKREAAPPQRRTIPAAPHRQLFLVNGYYCGADPSGPFPQEQQKHERDGRDVIGGGGSVVRPDADPAALSNRIGNALGSHTVGPAGTAGSSSTKNNTALNSGLSFYISPSVPSSFQIGNANSRGASPNTSSPPPQGSDTSTGKSHKSRKLKKLHIRQRFYEPVELQVESLSAFIMRLTLFMWYAVLLSALVIEVIPRVQWSMVNICGSGYHTDLRRAGKWSSPCVSSSPMIGSSGGDPASGVVLTWVGLDLDHLHAKLVRYRRIVVSLPTPDGQVNPVEDYNLMASTTMEGAGVRWTSNRSVTVQCHKKNDRCNMVRVPEDLLAETGSATSYNFSLLSVPPSLAAGASSGAVGIAYQRSSYTVATVVWRYVLIFLSLLHALRFIAFRRYTSTLYEQGWTLALQIALLWYLDPLFALNLTSWPMPSVLAFMEYRLPTYFVAVLVAYMLSVMTASMAWPMPVKSDDPKGLFARVKAFLARSRNVYDPPMWTKIVVVIYLLCVFVIDVIDACVEQDDWYAASDSNVRFKRLYWAVIALLLFGGLVCLLMLLYLRNYLGNKPYLESRPQQLACRVFIMIFLSAVVYYIIHCLVFFLLYNHHYPALASQQPFLQLPTLMVASFFVNIMTLVYTSQNRDDNVPINPKDFRWKHMVWPDTWYRWLARHGGSQYIFATEVEETHFYRLQFEFRKRQFMAKQKRKQQQQQQQQGLSGGSSGFYEPSTIFDTMRGATHSGLFSKFRSQNAVSGATAPRGSRAVAGGRGRDEGEQWRTDVWETPVPSRLGSPVTSDPERVDSGGESQQQQQGFPPSLADAGTVDNDVASGKRWWGRDAAYRSARLDRGPVSNSSVNFFSNSRNQSLAQVHEEAGPGENTLNNNTSINLAARSILNMDRFSTYFLADGGGGGGRGTTTGAGSPLPSTPYIGAAAADGSSGSGLAVRRNSRLTSPSLSPQRDPNATVDAFAIEGPARRRSRLLQNASTARRRDSSLLRREHTTTVVEDRMALNRTFAGFKTRRNGAHTPQTEQDATTPLRVGPGTRSSGIRHARSRSDGDVPHIGNGKKRGNALDGSSPQTSQMTHQPQPQVQRHRDPLQGPARAASACPGALTGSDRKDERETRVFHQGGALPNTEADPCLSGSIDTATNDSSSSILRAQQSEALLHAIRQVQQQPSSTTQLDTTRRAPRELPTFTATPTSVQPSRTDFGVEAGAGAGGAAATAKRRRASPQLGATSSGGGCASGRQLSRPLNVSTSVDDMASDLSQTTSDDDSSECSEHGHRRRSFFQTLSVVRERLGAVMGAAERNLFEKPARNLDRLEMQIFDAAYRPFQSMNYLPFFNLETAIDCYNISWEAYGVEKSVGDDMIETGINVTPQNVPRVVGHGVKKLVCGCCPENDTSSQDGEDSDDEASTRGDAAHPHHSSCSNGPVRYPHANMRDSGNNSHCRTNRSASQNSNDEEAQQDTTTSAAVPPASTGRPVGGSTAPPWQEGAEEEGKEMLEGHDSAADALHHRAVHDADDAVVIVHMSGEGDQNNVPKAERAPVQPAPSGKPGGAERSDNNNKSGTASKEAKKAAGAVPTSRGLAQGGPKTTNAAEPPASTPAAATDSNLYPINVEKYGYTLLLVAEAKEVQVIMVKMDTTAPEHRGKAPRIIIGFRGTANMSNAKYDMNIHRIVWREMERVEAEESQDGNSGLQIDMASVVDSVSTIGTQHLGCAACWRSCMRATSWRPTCHAGFLSIWKTLQPTVMRRLCEILREDRSIVYRIFTTGHSLGGALASLCAYSVTAMLRRVDYPIPEVTVYTYGQPRLGNRTFQRIYNKAVPRSFRVVNESDVVVSMTMFGGYHVGIEVDVDRYGNFIVKPTEIEKLFPPTTGRGLTVINHLMTNYGISLNAIATRTTCPARGLACYLTADPEKIEREKARDEAVKLLQTNKKPAAAT